MTRRRLSTRERARLFELHDGVCHICGEKIDGVRERWEIEHVIPFALTRDESDENMKPAHANCHKGKTAVDKGVIAKSKRVAAKHNGTWAPRSKLPGSRDSGWKHTFRHGWVRR